MMLSSFSTAELIRANFHLETVVRTSHKTFISANYGAEGIYLSTQKSAILKHRHNFRFRE